MPTDKPARPRSSVLHRQWGARSQVEGSALRCNLDCAAMQARPRPTLDQVVLICTPTGSGARAPRL